MKVYVITYTKAPSYRKLLLTTVEASDRYNAMQVWRKKIGKGRGYKILSIVKTV